MFGSKAVSLGPFPIIAFLISLMIFAGAIYASTVAIEIIEIFEIKSWKAGNSSRAQQAATLRAELEKLERKNALIKKRVIDQASIAKKQAELEKKSKELAQLDAAFANFAQQQKSASSLKSQLEAKLKRLQKSDKEQVSDQRNHKQIEERVKLLDLDIKAVEDEITDVKREIKTIGDKSTRSVASLVPGGILKSAIYAECDAKGVLLMPGGVRIPIADGSTLDEALPATLRKKFVQKAKERAVVMFLIRPDGFRTFRAFRLTVDIHNKKQGSASQIEFGYQPVEADWKLVYPGTKRAAR